MSIPNPGSPEAKRQGCRCPVMDNAAGRGAYLGGNGKNWQEGGVFVVVVGCPLHHPHLSAVPAVKVCTCWLGHRVPGPRHTEGCPLSQFDEATGSGASNG